MREQIMDQLNGAPAMEVIVEEKPIKGDEYIAPELLHDQAEVARESLVRVDYKKVRGTCGDERLRELRASVFGGPNVNMLATAELAGFFSDDDQSTGEERLARITDMLTAAGFLNGGHEHCAANGGFNSWMDTIAKNPEAMKSYARQQRGEAYDDDAMNEVITNAQKLVASKRYQGWDETVLRRVLGDEADEAIEKLADGIPHEAKTFVRNRALSTTVDQKSVYERSVIGKGSFVHDDDYADALEHVVASGADADHMKLVAEHAREAILAAVANAVPNETIYQIDLTEAA